MRYVGLLVMLLVGVYTEKFAAAGFWGWMAYTALIVIAVLLVTVRIKRHG